MHVTIVPIGSRGDVQPGLALALGLRKAGCQVRVATHGLFAAEITKYALEFRDVGGDPLQILNDFMPALNSANPLRSIPALLAVFGELIKQSMAGTMAACQDTDVIVTSMPALFATADVAARRGVPLVTASLHPTTNTRYASHPLLFELPWLPPPLRELYNQLTHVVGQRLVWEIARKAVNEFRQHTLGLPPLADPPLRAVHEQRLPLLYGFSQALVPRPADWEPHNHVTGFWTLPDEAISAYSPPPALAAFLESGPPPVFIGFSSMTLGAAAALDLAVEAVRRTGQRAVLATGWAGYRRQELPPQICVVDSVPHDWIFARVRAAILHGGVGSIAAALRAGIPLAVVTFSVEQLFWARRVEQVGASPPALARRGLTVDKLERTLGELLAQPRLRERAQAISQELAREDGVARSVDIILRHAPH